MIIWECEDSRSVRDIKLIIHKRLQVVFFFSFCLNMNQNKVNRKEITLYLKKKRKKRNNTLGITLIPNEYIYFFSSYSLNI